MKIDLCTQYEMYPHMFFYHLLDLNVLKKETKKKKENMFDSLQYCFATWSIALQFFE